MEASGPCQEGGIGEGEEKKGEGRKFKSRARRFVETPPDEDRKAMLGEGLRLLMEWFRVQGESLAMGREGQAPL